MLKVVLVTYHVVMYLIYWVNVGAGVMEIAWLSTIVYWVLYVKNSKCYDTIIELDDHFDEI